MGSLETITVTIREDPESHVWYVAESSLPGLNAEAESFEALWGQVQLAIQDLLDVSDGDSGRSNVHVEVIARTQLQIGSDA